MKPGLFYGPEVFPAGVPALLLVEGAGDGMWLTCMEARPTSLRELINVLEKAEQKFKRRLDPPLVIGLLRRVPPPDQAQALLDNEHHPDHLGTVWFEALRSRRCASWKGRGGRVGEA